jgi:hypothetical protein
MYWLYLYDVSDLPRRVDFVGIASILSPLYFTVSIVEYSLMWT